MLRRTAIPLLGAAVCAVGALLVWGLAFRVPRAEWLDGKLLGGLKHFKDTPVASIAQPVAELANPLPYTLMAIVVVGLAILTRGPRASVTLLLVLLGANLTTQYLKPLLAEQRLSSSVDPASWPSGHATAATALALCALMAAPRVTRGALALGATALAVGVSLSVVLLGWHYPSDALGGLLVAGFYACLGLAALQALETAQPPGRQSGSSPRLAPRARMNSRSESRFR